MRIDSKSKVAFQIVVTLVVILHPFNLAQADDLDGQLLFNNNCRTCHSMDEGDHRLGPTLNNVVGRKAGSVEGYAFSPSMKNSGLTWSAETLDQFIANPEAVVPGNQMQPYGGIEDENVRAALVKFLSR